jgi:hypothetical protein
MQNIYLGAALLVLAALAYIGITAIGKWALRKWDAHEVFSHARKVEREAKRKAAAMRRYSMTDLRPVGAKKS